MSWKSHGWDLEAGGLLTPARLGRLVSGLVLATWWRIALASPVCLDHLADLAARAAQRPAGPTRPVQLAFGWDGADFVTPTALPPPAPPARLWAAKFSLLTWSAKAIRTFPARSQTPAFCWHFPHWDVPLWSTACHQAYTVS